MRRDNIEIFYRIEVSLTVDHDNANKDWMDQS